MAGVKGKLTKIAVSYEDDHNCRSEVPRHIFRLSWVTGMETRSAINVVFENRRFLLARMPKGRTEITEL